MILLKRSSPFASLLLERQAIVNPQEISNAIPPIVNGEVRAKSNCFATLNNSAYSTLYSTSSFGVVSHIPKIGNAALLTPQS